MNDVLVAGHPRNHLDCAHPSTEGHGQMLAGLCRAAEAQRAP